MAVQVEVWKKAIEENLHAGFEHIKMVATDDSADVNSETIKVPNAGSPGGVIRNPKSWPLPIDERDDVTIDYTLKSFAVKPKRLGWADGLQLSYDKVKSTTNDMMGSLGESMKDWVLSQWWTYNANTLISTSATATETNWLTGGTGDLKVLTGDDVVKAASILDREKFPYNDRFLTVDYMMFRQLIEDQKYNAARIGVIGQTRYTLDPIFGFTIVQLPFVAAVSANTGTVTMIEPSEADSTFTFAAGNRPIALAFHKSAVRYAWTPPEVFTDEKSATMQGDVLSAAVYGGGKYSRTNANGVVAIRATV